MLSERPAANLPLTFRAAAMQDLPQIKTVYRKIVHHMNAQRIEIWDERYPAIFWRKTSETAGCTFCCTAWTSYPPLPCAVRMQAQHTLIGSIPAQRPFIWIVLP